MLTGMDYVIVYLDDIHIKSESDTHHNQNIRVVFKIIAVYGFKLNPRKWGFLLKSIKYLDQIIIHNGRESDPASVEAIRDMRVIDNVTTVQAFLWLVSYYNMYNSKVHDLRAPLNKPFKKGEIGHCRRIVNKKQKE